jgi:hypothetical protein
LVTSRLERLPSSVGLALEKEKIVNLCLLTVAFAACAMTLLIPSVAAGQEQDSDKVDLAALTQIKNEAFQRSQVMEDLFYISEVFGPRVNNSRHHRAAAGGAQAPRSAGKSQTGGAHHAER